jgi:phage terminase large subunit
VQAFIKDRVLYIRREAVKRSLELDQTVQFLAEQIPQICLHTVRADSARPESISYLAHNGMPRCLAAKKGPGSVEDGVAFVKSFDRVVIHPDCPETAREFRTYSYKVDRLSGDILPVLSDSNNHCIDALRYALEPMIRLKARPRIRAL